MEERKGKKGAKSSQKEGTYFTNRGENFCGGSKYGGSIVKGKKKRGSPNPDEIRSERKETNGTKEKECEGRNKGCAKSLKIWLAEFRAIRGGG